MQVSGQKLKVLFVSHDASATGAPNSLLNFIDCVRSQNRFDFRILLLDGGPLEPAFAKRGPCLVINGQETETNRLQRILERVSRRVFPDPEAESNPTAKEWPRIQAFLNGFQPDLLYLNSVAAAPTLGCLPRWPIPVTTYVRELEEYVQKTIETGWFTPLVERTSLFFSVSEAAKMNLVLNHGIRADRFAVVPTFVDVAKLGATPIPEARKQLRKLIGKPDCESIVVGCGTTDWRKGADLFISVANSHFLRRPESKAIFVWIGGMTWSEEKMRIHHDLKHAGLADRVFFPGSQANSANLIGGADVLALTSREDPFPRVMLEAGIAHVPIVCFKQSGGAEEFIAKGTGFAADYLDVTGFAEAIHKLLSEDDLRKQMGRQAHQAVITEHNSEISAKRIMAQLETLVNAGKNGHAVSKPASA